MSNTKIGAKEKLSTQPGSSSAKKVMKKLLYRTLSINPERQEVLSIIISAQRKTFFFGWPGTLIKNIKAGWTHWIQILLSLKNYFCSMNTAAVYWKNLNLSLSFSSSMDMRS